MRLLMNKKKLEQCKNLLVTQERVLWPLLYIAGIVGIGLFADFRVNQNSFVSENALLPGYVMSKYNTEHKAAKLSMDYKLAKDKQGWILDNFRQLGLEVYTQEFTVDRPLLGTQLQGTNIYAIYRAPKASSTESLVFSTTLKSYTQHAVPLMISVAELLAGQTIWAKDVVFLICEHEEFGVAAWLQAYHDVFPSPHIKAVPLPTHAGAIQAAIHVDMPFSHFDQLTMHVEAVNGQLPDIDMVVLVRTVCTQEGIHLLLHNKPHDIVDFVGSLQGLHSNMAYQAAGRIASPHSLYHPYNIHAVGVQTTEGKTTRKSRHNRFKWGHMGRFVEGVLRSCNNLEEQFHTAYYFYLMPSVERFVCLSVYMIPCGLLLGAAAVRVLALWLMCGEKETSKGLAFSTTSLPLTWCVYPLTIAIALGAVNELFTLCSSSSTLILLLGVSQIFSILSPLLLNNVPDWRLHQALALLLHVLSLVLLCMLNISLTLFYGVPSTLAYLLQFPGGKVQLTLQRLLLLLCHPLVLVVAHSYLFSSLNSESNSNVLQTIQKLAVETIESKYTLGVWTWSAYGYLLLPVWALQWGVRLGEVVTRAEVTVVEEEKEGDKNKVE